MLKKRFIAGASCKQCQQQDVIRWCKDNETTQEWIECVNCGYHENRADAVMQAEHPQATPNSVQFVTFK